MNVLKERRYFGIADYKEETDYLEMRHSNGLAFSDYQWRRYIFEKVPQEEMQYQIAINRDGGIDEQFITLYEDYGWEYVLRRDNRFYFRRKKAEEASIGEMTAQDAEDLPYYIKTLDDEVNHQLKVMSGIGIAPLFIAFLMSGMVSLIQSFLIFALPVLLGAAIMFPNISRLLKDKQKLMRRFDEVSQSPDVEWRQRESQQVSTHKEIYTKKQISFFIVIGTMVLLAGFALGYVVSQLLTL